MLARQLVSILLTAGSLASLAAAPHFRPQEGGTPGQAAPARPAAEPAAPAAPAARGRPSADRTTRLVAGEKAPALAFESWVKGEPVGAFETGKVYVIEFWATWCGPCIAGIGHLTELQHRYGERGLVVIGATARDARNELAAVEAMVAMRGAGMDYRVAWDGRGATHRAYMGAAGLNSIPAAFVVGKDGTLEYIGHPQTLELVVPKLLDGTWERVRDSADIKAAEGLRGRMDAATRTDPAKAMELYRELATRWPIYADRFLQTKFELERSLGQREEAAKTLARIEARSIEQKDVIALRGLVLRLLPTKDEPGVLDQCLRVALASVEASNGKDATSHRILAKVHQARGDQAKAVEAMRKAVEAADPKLRGRLEEELKAMEEAAGAAPPAPPATP